MVGDRNAVRFPRSLADRPFHFSFSGLKTSVVNFLTKAQETGELPSREDVAASVQEAIVDVLVDKTFKAVDETGVQMVGGGGGVLANRRLRERFAEEADNAWSHFESARSDSLYRQRRDDRRRRCLLAIPRTYH